LNLNLHGIANFLSRTHSQKIKDLSGTLGSPTRPDQIACDLVGGIFDLHGTANQISKGSQKVELAKLLGIWKKIGLALT